jgi:SAM-dependent methyltransferase
VGIDSSQRQIGTAKKVVKEAGFEERIELKKGDLEELPLSDDVLDHCMMIASLHHIPTKVQRVRALDEAYRCTKPGGFLQVSVWTWDQERFRNRHLDRINGAREPDVLDGPMPGDFLVPWKMGERRNRFYHLYGPGELEGEVSASKWSIIRSYFDGRNHWVECFKAP